VYNPLSNLGGGSNEIQRIIFEKLMAMFRMARESRGRERIPAEQQADKPKPERSDEEKSWGDYFREPIETVYIQMNDNVTFKHTSHDEGTIDLSTQALQSWLKRFNKARKKDYGIGDIKLVIHNHRKNSDFSDRDYKTHRDLKQHGFNGHFMIYSHIAEKAYFINDKEKK